MIHFTARFTITNEIHWNYQPDRENKKDEINLNFYYYKVLKSREAILKVKEDIAKNNIQWLTLQGSKWIFDLDLFKEQQIVFKDIDWLKGKITVGPEVESEKGSKFGDEINTTRISFYITRELVNMNSPTKIFLSHKGANKPLVRDFNLTLKTLGFDTWLDEDSMPAGTQLARGILQGFKDSCAVVFFITPEFQDEKYLATEVNYAKQEILEKGERFSIITLVFKDNEKPQPEVPELLKEYTWKEPSSHLEAVREIIKALPIKLQSIVWKLD